MVNRSAPANKCSVSPLGDVQVIDHLAEGPTVTVLAILGAWGQKAKSGVGLCDGRYHLIRLSFEDEGAREVFHGGCSGIRPGTLDVVVQRQPRERVSWVDCLVGRSNLLWCA